MNSRRSSRIAPCALEWGWTTGRIEGVIVGSVCVAWRPEPWRLSFGLRTEIGRRRVHTRLT
jgi:hypothetical protein